MPSLFTHLDVADQCIQAAKLNQAGWLDYNCFLSGSLAPDLGYFNPKELLFTYLNHSRKNRKIIKELFKKSHTPEEKSFSLGFLSHLISDKIMEKLVYWQSNRMFCKPWYMLKKPQWRAKLPQDLHHQRIEWSLDIDALNTPSGKHVLKNNIHLPVWSQNNLITRTYKKLFNLDINYTNLDASLNALGRLKPKILKITSIVGLKNILEKRYYPLEKLGYHVLRKIALLLVNLKNNPIYFWSVLDPYRLDYKQKKAFARLKDRSVKKFVRYIQFNKSINSNFIS